MNKIKDCFILSLILILTSCMSNDEMAKWSEYESEIAPLTMKEKKFVESLKEIGFHTTIEHYFIGRNHLPSYQIIIKADSSFSSAKNCTELEIILKNLSNTLYKDVIADSIIYDTGNLQFDITGTALFDDSVCNKKYGFYTFSKKSLETSNHFKVEKIKGKNNYYRKQI